MHYQATLTVNMKSRYGLDRIERQLRSLFEFGTITGSLADGLHLDDNPSLIDATVSRLPYVTERPPRRKRTGKIRMTDESDRQQ